MRKVEDRLDEPLPRREHDLVEHECQRHRYECRENDVRESQDESVAKDSPETGCIEYPLIVFKADVGALAHEPVVLKADIRAVNHR